MPRNNKLTSSKSLDSGITPDSGKIYEPKLHSKGEKQGQTRLKYLANSEGKISLTRRERTIGKASARDRFFARIATIEQANNISISEISKTELWLSVIKHIETERVIILDKDDSSLFRLDHIRFPNLIWLYIFVTLFPNILEFADKEQKIFADPFIQKNFYEIFKDCIDLKNAILYDALLKALDKAARRKLHKFCEIHLEAYNKDNPESMQDNITGIKNDIETAAKNDKAGIHKDLHIDKDRAKLFRMYLPSVCFYAHQFILIRPGKDFEEMRKCNYASDFLNPNSHYKGSRMPAAFKALMDSYPMFVEEFRNMDDLSELQKNICLYHFNAHSNLLDLQIIHHNYEFISATIKGLFTQHVLDNMMQKNVTLLKEFETTPNSEKCQVALTGHICSRNFVIKSISMKDLEFINFLIERSAESLYESYFKNKTPKKLNHIISGESDKNSLGSADLLGEPEWFSPPLENILPETLEVDQTDYKLCREMADMN